MEISPIPGLRAVAAVKPRPVDPELTAFFDIESTARPGDDTYTGNGKKAAGAEENEEDNAEDLDAVSPSEAPERGPGRRRRQDPRNPDQLLRVGTCSRSTVHGSRSTVHGQRSTVHGPRSTVHGPRTTFPGPRSLLPHCYTGSMQDEAEFRRAAEATIEALKQHLIAREEDAEAGFEVEEQAGALNVLFPQPGGKFVITPNMATRQIWIAGPSDSFSLDWNEPARQFILPRTHESLMALVDRLVDEHREP